MAERFQAASLVASPSYPNSVAWSDENLVAVASGHLVTILNPDMPFGPRGLITIPVSKPFPIGVIERKDLLSGGLLPISLSRDLRPCVRSISWSPIGFAPNSGCLLAVCTTEGRVKLYRFPFCEFSAEWVEVMDISEMLYTYLANISFWELDVCSSEFSDGQESQHGRKHGRDDLPISKLRKDSKLRKHNELSLISAPHSGKSVNAFIEVALFPCSLLQEGSSVEVFMLDGGQHIWVAGMLNQLEGEKAHVIFPETSGKGKQDKWVEIDPQNNSSGLNLLTNTYISQENHFPKIRPSIYVGKFPEQILLGNCHGKEDILKVGQAVEAQTNDRWFEGTFMGLNESGVQVKLCGDMELVTLDAASVRLAPTWVKEQKSWQVNVIKIEMNCQDFHEAVETPANNLKGKRSLQIVSVPKYKPKSMKKLPEKGNLPLISTDQYATRNSMLSSLVVAWSPILQTTSEFRLVSPDNSSYCCSILAVGAKSGRISFWKIHKPEFYSIMHNRNPTAALLIGFLHAHRSWITAISWALSVSDSSSSQLFLATGSSDGSVKIWQCYSAELLNSSEISHGYFSLFHEVITVDSVPVSVLSLIVPVHSANSLFLAVGKGSGSLEVWICEISTRKFHKAGSYDAHGQIVTGFAWAFDGNCLYSCSQDDSVRCWVLNADSLCEVPLPSNTPGVKSSIDVPTVFDSCFGLAKSPGNLAVAVARIFDADLLNPMYQSRSQKAAVEFFWIGGQQLNKLSNEYPDFDVEAFPGFSNKELVHWEHNILWSLKQHEHLDKPVVIWDIVAVLLAFMQFAPKYVDHVLAKWLRSYVGSNSGHSPAQMVSNVCKFLSNITTRQLHLLNIISRRVVLTELKADKINCENQSLEAICEPADEQTALWMKLLKSSEKELRERLVVCSFSAVIDIVSHSSQNLCKSGYWQPVGLAQKEQWIESNHDHVRDYLKVLKSEVGKIEKSKLCSVSEYVAEEQCSYCSASVPFESAEAAFCQGVKCNNGAGGQKHKLARCSVSMLVNPITPLWFCVCCHRWASKLAPQALFTMLRYPKDVNSSPTTSALEAISKPLCPFCGILLQRLQPEFLLSASPV